MPNMPAPLGLEEIDPELSASTGLTNIVAGRLAIFEGKGNNNAAASGTLSAQPTPVKESDAWTELEATVEDDDYEIVEEDDECIAAKRDAFIASLQGSKADIKNQIGERLYHCIANIHGDMAGKLTGMFLEASDSHNDLALLIFSEPSLRFHCEQAIKVLQAPAFPSPAPKSKAQTEEPTSPVTPDAPGAKRLHSHSGSAQQYPFNGKKAKTQSSRPFFAEITDDTGKRTRVPCRYDTVHKMYVPTGGRDVASGAKKVGTRDKTPEDLQALELGENDEDRLRARQKQIDIGMNTDGYKALKSQNMSGRALQDTIGLPYITEEGTLEKTLKCSKKRYDGYLRMWKRKLYEFSAVQRMDFSSFPPISEESEVKAVPATPQGVWGAKAAATASTKGSSGRKQGAPTRHTPKAVPSAVVAAAGKKKEGKSWADMVEDSAA